MLTLLGVLALLAAILSPVSNPVAAAAAAPAQVVGYYNQWDIYGNAYYLKNLVTSGAASRLTTLIYSFENIDPTNLTCFQTVKASDTSEQNPSGGDGAGDAWADYQKSFDAATSVNGKADSPTQKLKGNFNQLRLLKAKYPNLKVLLSIGGWTFSKYFSDAAATPVSRQKFVKSCIDMFIKGNLPTGVAGDPSGGASVAANIFDGIDIDWEFPAAQGHLGNHYGPQDTANYTALLAEFRKQLDGLGKHYLLTAAVPAGPQDIAMIQVNQLAKYLDWADVMTYDMHGAWENTTNFQDPLYPSSNDPSSGFSVQDTVNQWHSHGLPANKLVVGIPFYWRGWTGVPAGSNHGLYQSSTGPSAPFPVTQTGGTAAYKELKAAGKLANQFFDPTTQSSGIYDGTNFFTGDTPQAIAAKMKFITSQKLAGAMIYSLDDDDSSASLLSAVFSGLGSTGSGTFNGSSGDPCFLDPPGSQQTRKIFGGTETRYDRQASLYQICEGFGAPEGLLLTPSMKCAIIAAAATYGGSVINVGVSKGCFAGDILSDFESGQWIKDKACDYFSDIFAKGIGIFVASAASETGPGAVAIGVKTYRALVASLKVVCGGVFNVVGQKIEANHEAQIKVDVVRRGKCMRLRTMFGQLFWSAASCS